MIKCIVKKNRYFDSVTLMNVARDMREIPDIEDAALMMGTKANKGLLKQADLFTSDIDIATANDLVLVLKGTDQALELAIAKVESRLTRRSTTTTQPDQHRPRTIRTAFRSQPNTNLVVISVSGQYAAAEAWQALHEGLHVLLFSDNVPLADEIALKRYAVDHNLLLMGPGAGTAIINGVALGFANVLPRGPVGIVSAAGTGLQEVSTLLAKQGVGISQGIGVGGRDLSDEVDAMMMIQALDVMQEDHETEVIVTISKHPSLEVAKKVCSKLNKCSKPSVVIFMGEGFGPIPDLQIDEGMITFTNTLQEAALKATALATGGELTAVDEQLADQLNDLETRAQNLTSIIKPKQVYLRGLFSGGTLCEEAMRIWSEEVQPVWSNVPLRGEWKLDDSGSSQEHCAWDLGSEEFTVGRPHPMIDQDLRISRLLEEANDPSVAVIQMDIVLGFGTHPDPANELGPAIEEAKGIAGQDGRSLIVLLSITGTDDDPQDLNRQQDALEREGAIVVGSNAAASWLAAMIAGKLTSK